MRVSTFAIRARLSCAVRNNGHGTTYLANTGRSTVGSMWASVICAGKKKPQGTNTMKSKMTPGPWVAHGLTVATKNKLPAQVIGKDPRHIDVAVACFDHEESDLFVPWDYDTAAANADAIALLPELVEALREICRNAVRPFDLIAREKDVLEVPRIPVWRAHELLSKIDVDTSAQ